MTRPRPQRFSGRLARIGYERWYVRPLYVSVNVAQPRDAVYDCLDVLANHERFTDHLMRN